MAADPVKEQNAHAGAGTASGSRSESPCQFLPELVRSLSDAMRAGNISRLEVEQDGLRLILESRATGVPVITEAISSDASRPSVEAVADDTDDGVHVVTAPMIGTFYVSPAPGEPPFIQPGDTVAEGETIGIIEAMKIMNEIAADCSGEVVELLVENGQTVEYGSPLVRLRVAE